MPRLLSPKGTIRPPRLGFVNVICPDARESFPAKIYVTTLSVVHAALGNDSERHDPVSNAEVAARIKIAA